MLHTSYYTNFAYNRFDFNLVADHIYASQGKPRPSAERAIDIRFEGYKHFQGMGDSALMRVNACAGLRLTLWCLKPTNSKIKQTVQYIANVTLKPLAAAFDAIVNTALLVMKIALIPIIVVGKIIEKVLHPHQHIKFRSTMCCALLNTVSHLDPLLSSYCYLFYQGFALFCFNWLGPLDDLYFRTSDSFNWAYWVQNEGKDELILDINRVRYMKEKCGWEHVSDEVFMSLCPPWSNPSTAKISYREENNKLFFEAIWAKDLLSFTSRESLARNSIPYASGSACEEQR